MNNRWQDGASIKIGMRAPICAALGRLNDDPTMSIAGLQAYSRVLLSVNQLLQHPDLSKSDSHLAVRKLLAVYEAQAASGFNWERHTLGVLRQLKVRGPTSHTEDLAHSMFLDVGYRAVIAAIKRRERTFL